MMRVVKIFDYSNSVMCTSRINQGVLHYVKYSEIFVKTARITHHAQKKRDLEDKTGASISMRYSTVYSYSYWRYEGLAEKQPNYY